MSMYNLQKQHGEHLECPCTAYRHNMMRMSNVHVQPTDTIWWESRMAMYNLQKQHGNKLRSARPPRTSVAVGRRSTRQRRSGSLGSWRFCLSTYTGCHSGVSTLNDSLTHSMTHLLTHGLGHWLNDSLTDFMTHSLTHSMTHLLTHGLAHWLYDSLADLLTHSLT